MTEREILLQCQAFVREQSEGEWDDKTINADAARMARLFAKMLVQALPTSEEAGA